MPKKTITKTTTSEKELIKHLLETNIILQKKSTDLLISMNDLTKKIDKLLTLFETAAKNIEKGEVGEPLAKKLDFLLEQNKTIARGLILLEKYVRDKTTTGFAPSFSKTRSEM